MLAPVHAVQAPIAPAIDGNASAAAWKRAAPLRLKTGGEQVLVYVLEDERYIYVAAHAAQREKITAATLSDGESIARDDELTLKFIAGSRWLTFSMNPFGAHDAHASASAAFAPHWKSAGRVLPDGYDVTARIPRNAFDASAAWSISVERRIAAKSETSASQTVHLALDAPFSAGAKPELVAGAQGKFFDTYRSLWPTPNAPYVPSDAGGVAVRDSRQGVTIAALDAHAASREDDAQSIVYKTPDDKLSAAATRVQTTDTGLSDLVHSVSLNYDNHAGITAGGGIAVDRSVRDGEFTQGNFTYTNLQYSAPKSSISFHWSAAGADYDPIDAFAASAGTTNYSAEAKRRFGNVDADVSSTSSRDDLGTLLDAEDRLRVSIALPRALRLSIDAAGSYANTVGAYNENGAMLSYGGKNSSASASYHAGRYLYGLLQDSHIAASFSIPLLGSLDLAHRQTNFYGFDERAVQQSTSAGLRRKFGKDTAVAVSYRSAGGYLPLFLSQSIVPSGGLSFSLDRHVKAGLLHFSIDRETSALAAPASFSMKFVPN